MPYAELLEFNQPNPVRKEGFTKIRDQYELDVAIFGGNNEFSSAAEWAYFDPERIVEFAGRADYGPKNTVKLGTDETIISRWIDAGHHSMLEFASATFYIECSRVVSHELVRHRLASFQQESQRYVKYEDLESSEVFVFTGDESIDGDLRDSYKESFGVYRNLRAQGVKAQLARYVLPNAMMTRMVMKANLREWRHIVNLRLHNAAQPEMQELMQQIYDQLVDVFPRIMHDATEQEKVR